MYDSREKVLAKSQMTGDINDNVLSLLNEMDKDVMRKQDAKEANEQHRDLLKRLTQVEEAIKSG